MPFENFGEGIFPRETFFFIDFQNDRGGRNLTTRFAKFCVSQDNYQRHNFTNPIGGGRFITWAVIPWGSRGPDLPFLGGVGSTCRWTPLFLIQATVFHVHFHTKFKLVDHNFHQGIVDYIVMSVI
jgi:hypothetical protein